MVEIEFENIQTFSTKNINTYTLHNSNYTTLADILYVDIKRGEVMIRGFLRHMYYANLHMYKLLFFLLFSLSIFCVGLFDVDFRTKLGGLDVKRMIKDVAHFLGANLHGKINFSDN